VGKRKWKVMRWANGVYTFIRGGVIIECDRFEKFKDHYLALYRNGVRVAMIDLNIYDVKLVLDVVKLKSSDYEEVKE